MAYVHYRPWVGKHYQDGGRFGKRVLVVGESHYTTWRGEKHPEVADPGFTVSCVQEAIEGGGARFWTRLAYVLGGDALRN